MDKTIEEVLEEYKGLIKAKASIYNVLGADIEDIIQEGMIGLVKAYNSFDENKEASFKTYASLCIERQMINAVKHIKTKKNEDFVNALSLDDKLGGDSVVGELISSNKNNPEEELIYSDLLNLVKDPKLNGLSLFEQEVMNRLIDGKTYVEIANEYGKTPKQIDNAIQRIKKKIQKII